MTGMQDHNPCYVAYADSSYHVMSITDVAARLVMARQLHIYTQVLVITTTPKSGRVALERHQEQMGLPLEVSTYLHLHAQTCRKPFVPQAVCASQELPYSTTSCLKALIGGHQPDAAFICVMLVRPPCCKLLGASVSVCGRW